MTWANETCDDCAEQTSGGPVLHNELWATIATPKVVAVRCDPGEPFLFPIFQQVETFLCFGCIERRLGRQLVQEDLNTSPWNAGWIDNNNAGTSDSDSKPFKEMMEEWKARQARGRRLLATAS